MTQIIVTKDFIEKGEENFAEKMENFIQMAPQYVEAGLLPAAETGVIIEKLKADELNRKQKNENQKKAHDSRTIYVYGHKITEKDLREYKKLVCSLPQVTPEMKRELGLVNKPKSENTHDKKPILKVRVVGGVPHITFIKSPMQGIMLFAKTNNGEFDYQTTVKASYFDDSRPRLSPNQTEVREYYAYYIYKDKVVGLQSEIVRIVLDPVE